MTWQFLTDSEMHAHFLNKDKDTVIQPKYLIGFITSVTDKLLQGMWNKSLFEQTVH